MIYGYARISRKQQSIDRQIRNIKKLYPEAVIVQEAYTGTTMHRKEFDKLLKTVKAGDTIVFDSVSRMSRTAEDGVKTYLRLYEDGINLVFLQEPMINTDVYRKTLKEKKIAMTGTEIDCILKGINEYLLILAEKQIRIAFDQAEKEVMDDRQRTRDGIETARRNGKQIGQKKGSTLNIKKKAPAQAIILKHSKDFGGTLKDTEVMKLTGLARNTYYKYKRELKQRAEKGDLWYNKRV